VPLQSSHVRRLPVILAAAFGLLSLASLAATPVAHRYRPVLRSDAGGQGFRVGARLVDGRGFVSWRPAVPYRPAWAGQINRLGFRYTRWSDGSGEIGTPLLPAALLLGTAALAAGVVELKRRRGARVGVCPVCGYDLRATPGRCPECGTAAKRTDIAHPG